MADKRARDDLRTWLRRGDPSGNGAELPADEVRRMRQRILATPAVPSRVRIVPLAVLTTAAALTALLLLRPAPPVAPPGATSARLANTTQSAPAPRQIRFTTDRGTRIVWTLDPDFEL